MKCPKCHFKNPDDSKFCKECGTQIISSKEISASPTETLETPKEELTTGSIFAGRYQIIEVLGKGGMGKVYRALDKKLNEEVALKLVKPEIASDKKTLERFSNELKIARKIAHKNVGRVYELMEEKGTHFITMEYVPGEDLKSFIKRAGPLSAGKTTFIAKQVCEGLAEAHKLGVVHRDLKPQNIMIDKEGNSRIMDFGIARSLKAKGITDAGVMIGTPEYMSPEQVDAKETDQRSDIYSLGVILYEMVTGRAPFEGDTPLSIAVKQKTETPEDPRKLNSQIPVDLSNVILRCMEKNKEKRYQSAGELHSELINIEKGIPTTERIVPKRKPITSREITVTFGLKKLLIPALVVTALVIATVIIWQLLPEKEAIPPAPSGKPSIAVLPFTDLSEQKDQEYFCEGLADSIINALTNIQNIRVPARSSAFSFKGKERDINDIGNRLNVETVLEGSIQKVGNKLRITAQLTNVADEYLLWSEQYNRELDDVFAIQDEITLTIVDKLKIKLLGEEKARIGKRHTIDPWAYEAYLKGRYYCNKRSEEGMTKSIEYFKQSIEIDPAYALAYAGLADSYIVLGEWAIYPSKEVYPKAKAAALKALEIDDGLAEAHNALAMIKRDYDWDWSSAEKEFKRAIELNPNYPTAHQWYAEYLSGMGRHEESIAEIKRAQELDPLSLIINTVSGYVFYFARQYDLAIEQCQKTLDLDSTFIPAHYFMGLSYEQKGMYEEAIEELKKGVTVSKESPLLEATLAHVYALAGKRSKAQEILEELKKRSKKKYVFPSGIALIYCGLDEKDQAIKWLEKDYNERSSGMVMLKVDPMLDNLRSDPRFNALLKKIGLE